MEAISLPSHSSARMPCQVADKSCTPISGSPSSNRCTKMRGTTRSMRITLHRIRGRTKTSTPRSWRTNREQSNCTSKLKSSKLVRRKKCNRRGNPPFQDTHKDLRQIRVGFLRRKSEQVVFHRSQVANDNNFKRLYVLIKI